MNQSVQDQAAAAAPPPPHPQPSRRPRVREVSSRFMSPVASSLLASNNNNTTPTQQRSRSEQRQRQHPDMEGDENNRPSERQQTRAVMKLFKDNSDQQPSSRSLVRPDTPTAPSSSTSTKLRLMHHRSIPKDNNHLSAAKLLQSTGIGNSSSSSSSSSSLDDHRINHLPTSFVRSCSTRSLPDIRSSMPETDMFPTVSGGLLTERNSRPNDSAPDSSSSSSSSSSSCFSYSNSSNNKLSSATCNSPCSRSLDLPRSQHSSAFHSLKAAETKPPKQQQQSVKTGGLPLPPPPPRSKMVAADVASRKGRKGSGRQEDVHSLRLLHNHYLLWRFANAKAEASIQSQRKETQASASPPYTPSNK